MFSEHSHAGDRAPPKHAHGGRTKRRVVLIAIAAAALATLASLVIAVGQEDHAPASTRPPIAIKRVAPPQMPEDVVGGRLPGGSLTGRVIDEEGQIGRAHV